MPVIVTLLKLIQAKFALVSLIPSGWGRSTVDIAKLLPFRVIFS